MSAFAGSSLVVRWLQAAATTVLTGDHRNFSYTPSIQFYDQTAGADENKSYLPGVKDGAASYEAVMQAGADAGGTTTYAVLAEGAVGTIEFSPEGTTAGKTKYLVPALSQGAAFSYPYQDVVTVTVNWQQNGARTQGTN